jgi:radical SAM superfamily enzyme YgiQ (UPF0313 family)
MAYDCIIFTDVTYTNLVYKPMGAYKLANHLRSSGYSCLVVDHFHTFTQQQILDIIAASVGPETKFVGFSIAFFNSVEGTNPMDPISDNTYKPLEYNQSFCPQGQAFEIALVSAIHDINSHCKIVLGGAARISNQIKNPRVDYVISGFAEVAILDLVHSLELGQVPGTAVKNIWGTHIIDGGSAESFDYQHSEMVWQPEDVAGIKVLQLDVSRGCKFNCTFCDWSMRGTKNNKWTREIDVLASELQRNYDQYGIYRYFVHDHTFNESDYKLNVVKQAVKQLTFQPIIWCHVRPDLLVKYPNRTDTMYEVGVRSMMMGIETLDPDVAKTVGKGLAPEKIIAELKNIQQRYGNELLTHGNFVIGLPGESIDSVLATAARLENGDISLHHWSYNALMISTDHNNWWGSTYEQDPARYGYTENKNTITTGFNIDYRKNSLMNWRNDHMTFEQAMHLNKKLYDSAADNPAYLVDSMVSWALMGFTDLDFKGIQKLRPRDIDWFSVSKQRLHYLYDYKKNIIKHVHGK